MIFRNFLFYLTQTLSWSISLSLLFTLGCYLVVICPFVDFVQDCGLQLTDEPDKRCYPLEDTLLCHGCHLRRLNINADHLPAGFGGGGSGAPSQGSPNRGSPDQRPPSSGYQSSSTSSGFHQGSPASSGSSTHSTTHNIMIPHLVPASATLQKTPCMNGISNHSMLPQTDRYGHQEYAITNL